MDTTLKGALAAGAAAALLLGGAGTLAFWDAEQPIAGTDITSGELKLGTPTCGDWQLDSADLGTQLIVPGDTLTRTCTLDLVATGKNVAADLEISTPAWDPANDLTAELTPTAVFTVGGASVTEVTSADDTGSDEIEVEISVEFPFGTVADNGSQDLTATLDEIVISATQTEA